MTPHSVSPQPKWQSINHIIRSNVFIWQEIGFCRICVCTVRCAWPTIRTRNHHHRNVLCWTHHRYLIYICRVFRVSLKRDRKTNTVVYCSIYMYFFLSLAVDVLFILSLCTSYIHIKFSSAHACIKALTPHSAIVIHHIFIIISIFIAS